MNYREFTERVSAKAALDTDHAEAATQAVLSVLGESLSEGEIRHLSSQLAAELKTMLQNVPGHGRPYTAQEFLKLVAERERVPEHEARLHTQAVLSTLREAVDRGELAEVFAELWRDPEYDALWAQPALDAWSRPSGPAAGEREGRLSYEAFLSRVQERAGLDRGRAEDVTEAVLSTLADRITRGEAEDLAAELPPEMRPWLLMTGPAAEGFSAREFIWRVGRRVPGLDREEVERAVSAVLSTLREAVSPKEVRDMFSQLPADILALFSVRAGGRTG
jgi:uncharacterized protein (DUF2267 family)